MTPGWVHAWRDSAHGNLDGIRNLDPEDSRFYKKAELERIEAHLASRAVLQPGEQLDEVGCIDCHGGVGSDAIEHHTELRMPDRAVCGKCHLQQFAEAESEKEQTWPQGQWPQGHPSHAVDWKANVHTAVWAAMPQREVAQGCDMCHYQQNKCDGCHTRHSFSAAEARMPEACATCHNGVDHNEFENFMLSKHGVIYQTTGKMKWDFEVPLKDAMTKGGYTAPTCVWCHAEFEGEFTHNLVRKVRWGFNPTPAIADNLGHPWFEERKDSWVRTCSNCHSARFARDWLDTRRQGHDPGARGGAGGEEDCPGALRRRADGRAEGQSSGSARTGSGCARRVLRPVLGEGQQPFAGRPGSRGHVGTRYLIKHYKGLFHMNPGGFTYTEGWSELLKRYTEIQNENTRIREMDALRKEVEMLKSQR